MPLNVDSLKNELRTRLGDPSPAELPDTAVEAALKSALAEFSRYRPRKGHVELAMKRGVDRYPLPAGVAGATSIWVLPTAAGLYFDPLALLPGISLGELALYGFHTFDDLAWSWDVEQAVDGEGNAAAPLLVIDPVPDFDGAAVVETETPHTWDSVGPADENALLTWARGEALEYIGRKRSKSVTRIPTASGQLTLNTGYNDRADGRQLKKDFCDMMGGGATVVDKG